jgi:predicted secreted protein
MRISALLAALFVASLVASLALASPTKKPKPGTTTTTTTASKPKCDQVELKGNVTAGSVTFTVIKANKRGRSLVGTPVTLVMPASAKVKAKACRAEGGALTLRNLNVKVSPAKP